LEFLNKAELRQLTGRAQAATQERWLAAQEIPHRRDGSRLIVSREHVRLWLEGKEQPALGRIHWNVPHMAGYDPTQPSDWDRLPQRT
jgi:hypothetical protein